MTRRPLAAAIVAATTLALTACGGDGGAADTGNAEAQARQAQLKFARCMREQGIDFPDPGARPAGGGGGGGLVRVGGDATPEEFRDAEKACAKYGQALRPPELSDEEQREFRDAALAHARCMRAHGIDFPDPQFSEDGGARVRLGPGGPDPEDPEVRDAQEACAEKLPQPGEER